MVSLGGYRHLCLRSCRQHAISGVHVVCGARVLMKIPQISPTLTADR